MCQILCVNDFEEQKYPKYPQKDWFPDRSWPKIPPNPKICTKIICPSCHQDSGYTEEGLRFYVIPFEGLKCIQCGYRFMKPTRYWL